MSYATFESCQPAEGEDPNPRLVFQWALQSMPFAGATPLLVQPQVRPEWSEMLWDLGFRHHPDLATKRIVPPMRGQRNSLNGAVALVGVDEPDPAPEVIQDPATLTVEGQEAQLEEYRKLGRLPAVSRSVEGAEIVSGPLFDPSEHTVSAVNGYLLAPIPVVEKRRVMAAEMASKKPRQGILNAPQNRGL